MVAATCVLTAILPTRNEAAQALRSLRNSLKSDGVEILEAAIVTLKHDHIVQIQVDREGEETTGGGSDIIEQLFPERICALAAVGKQADAAAVHFRSMGLEANLLKEIGENLGPTSAALVAVVSEPWVDHAGQALGRQHMGRFAFAPETVVGTNVREERP
jgi:uncharacterized membrane protein